MFEYGPVLLGDVDGVPPGAEPEPTPPVTAERLQSWITELTRMDRRVDDAERVTQLELLERLKSAAAAAQAEVTVDFAASQRAGQIAAGVPAGKAGWGWVRRWGWPGGTPRSAVAATSGSPRP